MFPKDVKIFSAGIEPKGIHPVAIKVMQEIGVDIFHQKSKNISEIPIDKISIMVTLCGDAAERCPVFPGKEQKLLLSAFLLEAVLIFLSGVIATGYVTAVTVSKGTKSPHAGAIIALGYGVVEIPLVILVLYGFGDILKIIYIKVIIGLLGGLFLLKMGIGLFKGIKQAKIDSSDNLRSPLRTGIILSLANPYFLVWWATVGVILIFRSYAFGLLGFTIFNLRGFSSIFWC